MKKRGIIYVNFSPYDNAGRILDYLIEHFYYVIHFSYDHLRLKNGRKTTILTIYINKKIHTSFHLIPIRTPGILRFPSLPFVALSILLQTAWYSYIYQKSLGIQAAYLSVNAYTAWVGNVMKKIGIVKRTIFWVWDYYPPGYPDWKMRLIRSAYWKFDKPAVLASTHLAFISKSLILLRKNLELRSSPSEFDIIPIGTNPTKKTLPVRGQVIGYLGMLKRSQGLDILFDMLPMLKQRYPRLRIEIIGSGPEEDHFRKRAKPFQSFVTFYGFIEKEDQIDSIIRTWSIGMATYRPDTSNEAYWADPSKIKAYLSQGVPVITTAVPAFAKELSHSRAGIVINYHKPKTLLQAISKIFSQKKQYSRRAHLLALRYEYKKVYKKFISYIAN